MDTPTITLIYTCVPCGLHNVTLNVKARQEESVTEWMDSILPLIAQDHSSRSPRCIARELTNLKIPITNAEKIGGVTIQ